MFSFSLVLFYGCPIAVFQCLGHLAEGCRCSRRVAESGSGNVLIWVCRGPEHAPRISPALAAKARKMRRSPVVILTSVMVVLRTDGAADG